MDGLPQKLLQCLMPFQREGVEFALSKNGRCMIADEMGLGKTVQAIAVAYAFRREWPLLVVVPSSLKYPWIEELERWIPELQPGDINLVETKSDTMRISSTKVTVLGYGLLTSDARSLVEALTRQRFAVVVVDESHYLKSRNAARTKVLTPLIQSAKRAVLLTGTPALGRPEELFMQIDSLYPGKLGTWSNYAKKYCNAHFKFFGSRRQWDCRGASNLDELHQRLREIMIRRLKKEVLSQLPPKIRQQIPFDLPKEAAKEASSSMAEWESLMRRLRSADASADNPFIQVMSLITHMYKQTAIAKASYIRIDGKVPSSERIQLVHKFQSDPETRVAILSIQAAGQGLTFTAASHVVFAELYWNPGHMKQAEDRAHRIGQTSSVNVHYLIAKGTFDTVMWSMLNRKENVTGSTLNGRKESLEAAVGDKDKWDFLNFADVWTPSKMGTLPEGNARDTTDGVFFTHFEKEKQHDIRSFFSPGGSKEKKRKRTPDRDTCSSTSSEPTATSSDQDASPQLKRWRKQTGASFTPDLAAKSWSCRACTFSNSSLLPYCEMCESPSSPGVQSDSEPPGCRQQTPAAEQDQACTTLSEHMEPDPTPSKGKRSEETDEPPKGKQKPGGAEEEDKLQDHRATDGNDSDEDASAAHPVHPGLQFCASQYTERIYLYSKDGTPLNLSFLPLSWDDLPEAFSRRRENRIQVLRFVQEWSSLTDMKRKLLRRSGIVFHSVTLGLQQLAAARLPHHSTERYLSRGDVAKASLSKAQQEGGSVRLVTNEKSLGKRRSTTSLKPSASESLPNTETWKTAADQPWSPPGFLQAVDSEGVPLCLSCQQPCSVSGGPWDTRFCSHRCQEDFQLRSSQTHMRSRMLEAENGVCQHCGLHAHDLFLKVRDASPSHRKDLLANTWLAQLPLKQLNELIRAPVEGDFWQVDHIRPVYSGGGQCSLENLQTLCTVCHKIRTAQQAKERSQMRKSATASKVASDITRFFVKK